MAENDDGELSPRTFSPWDPNDMFLPAGEATTDEFPELHNMSARFMYKGVVRRVEPAPPEYVAIRMDPSSNHLVAAVAQWNLIWEAAQFRRRFFALESLPEPMGRIADLGDVNITYVPRTVSRYYEYAPLVHLVAEASGGHVRSACDASGPVALHGYYMDVDVVLPRDFATRLERAWAWMVWPHLVSGSKMMAFSRDDPIRLLAHNLDFWVPAVTATIQDRLRDFPEIDEGMAETPVLLTDGSVLPGATGGNTRTGGSVWVGEDDARVALLETIDAADRDGRLRGILDAVRSHRIEDDFSDHWSYAREDFERKLHGKRRKVKVTFVELPDTVPVQGPESEVVGNVVTNDFLALLDDRNREIVVLLASGMTSKTEIADVLGCC